MPDLRDVVSSYDGARDGMDLTRAGVASAYLGLFLQDKRAASAIIAANFWKAYVESSSFMPDCAQYLGINAAIAIRSEKVIVCRERIGRHDLLLLAPVPVSPKSHTVTPSPDAIFEGWNRWRQNFGLLDGILWNHGLAVEPAVFAPPFSVTVITAPITHTLIVPDPALHASTPLQNSTAGVIATRRGRPGITLALHAVGAAANVQIGNATAPIVDRHQISDSCFAEVSSLSAGVRAPKGILKHLLPRGNQAGIFGRSNGSWIDTVVTSWSLDLPQISRARQDRIYTTDDVRPGDSGTALITDDGYVAGFAFEQPDPAGPTNFASWIWAHSVVDALDLSL